MKGSVLSALKRIDRSLSRVYFTVAEERNALLVLLFHSLFESEAEIRANTVHPQQALTVAHFRRIIEYFLEHGYRFVAPADLLAGLDPDGKYVLLTFDDGYYNNSRALPVMRALGVPAVFFISIGHVLENRPFWWDVFHRAGLAAGWTLAEMAARKRELKRLRHDALEAAVKQTFGENCFRTVGDTDRPFAPDELAAFAREPLVHLGNHTVDHANLTNYDAAGVRAQLRGGQDALAELTGERPVVVSYPNGNHSDEIVRIARGEGLRLGITGVTRKNLLPLVFDGDAEMRLGRMVPYGDAAIELHDQLRSFRADWSVYGAVRNFAARLSA